jgi:hypothetical protein
VYVNDSSLLTESESRVRIQGVRCQVAGRKCGHRLSRDVDNVDRDFVKMKIHFAVSVIKYSRNYNRPPNHKSPCLERTFLKNLKSVCIVLVSEAEDMKFISFNTLLGNNCYRYIEIRQNHCHVVKYVVA